MPSTAILVITGKSSWWQRLESGFKAHRLRTVTVPDPRRAIGLSSQSGVTGLVVTPGRIAGESITLLRKLRNVNCSLLPVVGVSDSSANRLRLLEAGADACVPCSASVDEIIFLLRRSYRAVQPTEPSSDIHLARSVLSPAEQRVLGSLLAGETVRQTASKLNLSVNTVRWHLKSIFRKTGCSRQLELVRLFSPNHASSDQ